MQQVLFVRHTSQTLVFSGTHVTGLLTALRTDTGVVESFDALITTGRSVDDSVRQTAIERAVTLNSMDFSMEHHFGADAMGVHSGADQFRVPLATVLGSDLLKKVVLNQHNAGGADFEVLGNRPFQHMAVKFPLVSTWDDGKGQALRQAAFQEQGPDSVQGVPVQ